MQPELVNQMPNVGSRWIFSDRKLDFMWLFLPGLVFILTNLFIRDVPGSKWFAAYFFLDASFLGSGHIYITGWRTYMNPTERRRSSIYLWAPLACFSVFFCWRYLSIPWLVYIPAYSQFWHHMRQSFGIQKWYQRQNGQFRKASDYFVQILITISFAILHFRQPTELKSLFFAGDLLLHPDTQVVKFLVAAYAVIALAWLIYEIRLLKHKEWNRLSYVALSIFINALCFGFGRNEAEIMFPLVAYHGVAYFGLTSSAMTKTMKDAFPYKRALIAVLLTAFILGTYERVFEFTPGRLPLFWDAAWAGLYATPIMLHYIYDAFLWRGKHAEAKLVYGPSVARG